MEQRTLKQGFTVNKMLCFTLFLLCFYSEEIIPNAEAYKNYTVGDSLGWFDKLGKSDVDYDKWVSGKNFSLGDFLIFNTDSNHTVIQTFSSSTYTSCDSQGDDNVQWSNIAPNSTIVRPITVPVPLMKEGITYFFSGDYDGEQCMNGQKFSINVTHGKGLPPSIRDNPDFAVGPTSGSDAPGPTNPESGDDMAAPDTVISNDFSHPKNLPKDSTSGSDDDEDDNKKSSSPKAVSNNWDMFFLSLIGGGLFILW